MEAKLHIFLNSTKDGGDGSNSVSGKQQLYPLTGGLVGPTTDLDFSEKGKVEKVILQYVKERGGFTVQTRAILV